jgi:hypothetical protein
MINRDIQVGKLHCSDAHCEQQAVALEALCALNYQ